MTITKAQLKSISNLKLKKFRNLEGKFLVEGERGVFDGLNSNHKCEIILVTKKFFENNTNSLKKIKNLEIVTENEFKKITETINPQGIAAVFFKKKQINNWAKNLSSDLIVCLEDVSDPGNVGAVIRNCDWFGIKEIIISENCADIYNPKTIRASVGSIFHLNIYTSKNLLTDLTEIKKYGYTISSSTLNGKNIYQFQSNKKAILILGNEANGVSNKVMNISDVLLTIPKIGNAESLNVASASAVILSELTKPKFL
ncbi:MAG: RNA methyltransferase [Ignavibacteriales bacterium CG_4_9_14_3_um_filter_30_11]|nr:MAG: RNA methyltransferase [Ignavibacteriales bacterium CG_4_9_14_3_um_filter_30_11]